MTLDLSLRNIKNAACKTALSCCYIAIAGLAISNIIPSAEAAKSNPNCDDDQYDYYKELFRTCVNSLESCKEPSIAKLLSSKTAICSYLYNFCLSGFREFNEDFAQVVQK